ncbi:uncharacterized protein LOC123551470 [Mercenaria mercenaria]|uniref:uncharacterized protein LOC123551470 n=1 Tax=Mercenaria mercenaria TaxID=6596 RepID=UPI00234EB86F|nr:uncharacterized protein LOC123551470 [Mercenaria mercenaria]
MELYFMPSDVARIVLGYLKESSYVKTYNCFLKECCHLKEIYNLEKAGRSLKKVTQFNLVKILEEWGQYRYSNENTVTIGNNFTETPSSDETVDDTLVCDNDVTNSGRKSKAGARSNSKKSPQVSKARRSPCTPYKVRLKSPRNSKNLANENNNPEKVSSDRSVERAVTGNACTGKFNEFTPKKSSVPLQRANSAEKAAVLSSPFINDAGSKTDIGRNIQPEVPSAVNCMKNTENDCDKTKADFPNKKPVDTKKFEVETDKKGKRENMLEGEIHKVAKLEGEWEDRTDQSEPKHRKTKETSTTITEEENFEDSSSKKVKIMSETFIKTAVEPPSESVGSCEDKCLAWMNKNESETMNRETSEHGDITRNINGGSTDGLEKTPVSEKLVSNENPHEEDVKAQEHLSTRSDESSNEVTTSKSSDSLDTHKSKTPHVVASTSNRSEQGHVVSQHVTPKKRSPGSRDKSLVTPVKFLRSSEHHTSRSPRRKKPKTPRKRTSEVSPVSVVSTKSVDPTSVNPIFEKILSDHRLHEKLAETCNLVHSQIKLANSGKENKSDTQQGEQVSPLPTQHSYEQETVTASRSLEEILGIDHNFHTDMLSDNIDMSDPAYESLFKLFGTDRETFNEYLRKEKEKELALMEAEVEELERSNHEIMCANFGVSQADAGYETQELVYSSPHHMPLGSQQDLFATQHASNSPRTGHATSTPCGNDVPINFTPLLRGNELGNSPVHLTQSVFGGLKNSGGDSKISPSSTATQPFSPAFSHYSEMNNPPTPRNQQHLSAYVNENSPVGTCTPGSHIEDPYSNPATPIQSNTGQIIHSTPTGPSSVRSQRNPDHFHHSSPIHSQHSAVKNSHAPIHCSPLVKADIHPDSPLLAQTNVYQSSSNNGLYFSSHITSEMAGQNRHDFASNGCVAQTENFSEHASGYLNLLNGAANIPASREPCTTIENTIGCISLPQPSSIESKPNKKKGASRSRRKKEPVKRKSVSASHATVKGLLEKPLTHLNSIPLSMKVADLQRVYRTPEKRVPMPAENLTFPSPGGKTLINVPLLNCEDQIDLSVLGMDENIDNAGSQTVNVYDQNLDTSTQYSIAPENQATHNLVNAIEAGNTAEVVQQIKKSEETKRKTSKRSNTERKSRAKKKKEETAKDEQHDHFSPTPPSLDQPALQQEGNVDPNQEIYTATPFTSLNKAATVRALNFGPNVDDPDIAHYRKIYPKLQAPADTSPSVLILNTNQVINPGQRVIVNTTPVTLVQKISNVQNDPNVNFKKEQNLETDNTGVSDGKDNSETEKTMLKRVTRSESLRHSKDDEKEASEENVGNCDTEVDSNENTPEETLERGIEIPKQIKNMPGETPRKGKQTPRKTRNLSKELTEELGADCNNDQSNEEVNTSENECKNDQECRLNFDNYSEEICEKRKDRKCKKKDALLKTKNFKNKGSKGKEKLKVKIPMISHRPPNRKGRVVKSGKSVIPFYFKKKTEIKSDVDSSDEDVPLSVVRKQQVKKKEYKSVELIVESETTDEEKSMENVQSESGKRKESSDDDNITSKEVLFEKIGLTPTKSVGRHDLKSPIRANALDVLAEWQSSPLSSRSRGLTPNTRNRFSKADDCLKSPTTPRRRTHAKQLFGSPCKESIIEKVKGGKAKQTAKRVDDIIDRLKQNNPDRNLSSANTNINMMNLRNNGSSEVDVAKIELKTKTGKENEKMLKESKSEKTDADRQNKKLKTRNLINDKGDGSASKDAGKKMSEMYNDTFVINDIVNEEYDQNSPGTEVIEDKVVTADRNTLALDESSQGASELNRAIASIAVDHPTIKGDEEQNLLIHRYNENELQGFNLYQNEDILSESCNTKKECNEIFKINQSKNEISDEQHKPAFPDNQDGKGQSETHNKHIVTVDVHAAQNSQDSCEMIEKFKDIRNTKSIQEINHELDSCSSETYKDIKINQFDSAKHSHDTNEIKTVDPEQVESKTREKKKKRKHRHCHRHKHEGSNEVNTIGDQFGTQSQGEREHHHKKKKKKSKKRHREDSEDVHESKRRRKEKTNVSLDSLAALNVDEALSQIYGKQPST